tara:strand:+ start:506 stop:628 length:123 start_codon:yes stop_codon:yes gene_type:complete
LDIAKPSEKTNEDSASISLVSVSFFKGEGGAFGVKEEQLC